MTSRVDGLVTRDPVDIVWTAEPLQVPADVDVDVRREWDAARAAQPGLYDGSVLAFAGWDGTRLTGRFVPYRYFVARRRRPELAAAVAVEPIGVTGVLHVGGTGGGVVLGRRRTDLTQHPGWWDLIPAGGIDAHARRDDGVVDATAQLFTELDEECGLHRADVRGVRWVGLFRDAGDGVWDLCFEIAASRPPRATGEHVETRMLSGAELARFLAAEGDRVTPLTRRALAECGLLATPTGAAR